MPPYIPGEVTDDIIAYLWGDKQSLLSCALVCHNWLPASRHNLFKHVQISSASRYDEFVSRVLRSARMQPWLASVRSFSLWETYEDGGAEEPGTLAESRKNRYTQRVVHDFACRLPALETMGLHGADWVKIPPHPSAFAAISSFSSLLALSITDCKFPSFTLLRRILTSFPRLEALTLAQVSWPAAMRGGAASHIPCWPTMRPKLHTFAYYSGELVDRHCDTLLLRWLAGTNSRTSLRTFAYHGDGKTLADVPISAFAPHVVGLTLSLTESFSFSLEEISSLRRLTVEIIPAYKNYWRDLHDLLRGISSELHELKLWVEAAKPDPKEKGGCYQQVLLDGSSVEQLDAIFDQENYRQLDVVEISVAADIAPDDVAQTEERLYTELVSRLPKLHARHILQAQVWPCESETEDIQNTASTSGSSPSCQ